jgi:formate C-acetyltransferase
MAESERGERKAELLEIAERVRHVPANPPRTFMEALQSLWMTNVVLEISYGEGNVFSQGRVDQYLYPYYESDLKADRIAHEKAVEAVEEYLVKLASVVIAGQNNITLGGVNQAGEDATNEMSYIFLEALANVKALLNTISVRISSKTPRDFLRRALEVHRYTAGMALYNDELIIDQLQKDGYSLEDARDYSIVGCVEPTGTGNDFSYTGGNGILPTIILLMALNEGRAPSSGNRRVGAATPDPGTFKTFEDVKKAFVEQLSFIIDKLVRMAELKDQAFAEAFPCVLVSSTIEGCLESGKDITWGGARYNNSCINGQGLATVANSLAAIRWAVFEQKLVTMEELVNHLRNNFKDDQKLRQKLLHQAPKYGNGDEKADELAEWVAEVFSQEVRKHKCGRGGIYRPSMVSAAGSQILEGKLCGATPDGRLAGEAVSNGLSPVNGTEVNGMTAALRSAAQVGRALLTDGTAMNLRISPSLLRKEENIDKMASLVEGYFKLGGRNIQFNPLDTATLRDAQAHPEKYPDLTVKVSGYSARFIDLTKFLQDDIIERTEFGKI